MSLEISTLLRLETLSKLKLMDNEREIIQRQLSYTIEAFREIEDLKLDEIEPLIYIIPLSNVLRDDIANKTISREEILENAPEQKNGCFQVPKTIE